jgi:hypothetical protein
MAEFGLAPDRIDDLLSAIATFSDWPDLAVAPSISANEWKAARLAILGLPVRSRALRKVANDLRPLARAVRQLGASPDLLELARLAHFGVCSTGSYVVFAHRAENAVRLTVTWTPRLASPTSP